MVTVLFKGLPMRIGLITDIHNHAAELAVALACFEQRGVDRVLTLGDTCDSLGSGEEAAQVAALLDACGAMGVWGNHDYGLCREVHPRARERYPAIVFEVMARMHPRLMIGEYHFSHRESPIDPLEITQLWELGEDSRGPDGLFRLAGRAFSAVDSRLQFVGHYHQWWAATPEGPLDWTGDRTLRFDPTSRYFVVVGPVFAGWCRVLDTDDGTLEPLRCLA